MKKILALLLAIMMILAMGAVAFAGDTGEGGGNSETGGATNVGTITIKPSDTVPVKDKTLKAYKIMDATYSGTGNTQAVSYTIVPAMESFFNSYPEFATGGKTATENATAAGKTLSDYVASVMSADTWTASKTKDFAKAALEAAKTAGITAVDGAVNGNNIEFTNQTPGYYVIEDTATKEPVSAVMLDTLTDSNVEITLKASDDTEKEILTAGELINKKANELGLGRAVNYKISQKIPDPTGYDYYYYLINDTLSTGLTFNPETVVVKVGTQSEATTKTLTEPADYHLYYVGDNYGTTAAFLNGKTFIVAFDDIVRDTTATAAAGDDPAVPAKFNVGDKVEVTYSATVNANAISGVDPLNNKVTVQYSNNPNEDERGDYENHPGYPANNQDHPTGEGPEKNTVTYSTKVTIMKVDGKTKEALPGVEFTLTGKAKDAVFKAEEVYEIDPAGTYWLLKNGKYTTTAPQTEVTLTETTGSSGWVKDNTYTKADGRKVGDDIYRPYVPATDSGVTHYVINEPNDADYASVTTKYKKVTVDTSAAEEYDVARTGITGTDGSLSFAQLGAGTYKLSETGVLDGYNAIPDISFTVTCTTPDPEDVLAGTETCEWNIATTTPGVTFTQEKSDDENLGTFIITIENNSGAELPSTGGIGTTIFYVAGSILVLAAVVLLVTKRRMSVGE